MSFLSASFVREKNFTTSKICHLASSKSKLYKKILYIILFELKMLQEFQDRLEI